MEDAAGRLSARTNPPAQGSPVKQQLEHVQQEVARRAGVEAARARQTAEVQRQWQERTAGFQTEYESVMTSELARASLRQVGEQRWGAGWGCRVGMQGWGSS